MASDAQLSGPLPGQKFTVSRWVQIFGAESGIHGDTDGSTFGLTLPPASDVAEVGSPTIDSIAIVGGFPLIIPAGLTQSLEIPPSTNASVGRTDIICARLDTTNFTTDPGPVRLTRIGGTEGSTALPSYDAASPSPDTLPLWAVTRKLGKSLTDPETIVRDLRTWTGPNTSTTTGGILPQSASLGSRAERDGIIYRRDFVGSSVQWVVESYARSVLAGSAVSSDGADYDARSESRLSRDGVKRYMNLVVGLTGDPANPDPEVDDERRVGRLATSDRPAASVALAGFAKNTAGGVRAAAGRVDPDGWVVWHWASTTNRFPTGSTITLTGRWETAT